MGEFVFVPVFLTFCYGGKCFMLSGKCLFVGKRLREAIRRARKTWRMITMMIVMVIMMMTMMMIVMIITMMIMMMMEFVKGKRWKDNWVRPRRAWLRRTEKAKVLQQESELFMQSWRR